MAMECVGESCLESRPTVVIFVGPAGAGKSSIVASYGRWLRDQGYRVATLNLDPAAEYIPYQPDFDVRKIVNAREIALREGLGPNGALIRSIEVLTERLGEILEWLRGCRADFLLVDTPGQMELFVFRDLSHRFIDALKGLARALLVVFVVDAEMLRDASDYAFLALMCTAIQLRLDVDVVAVVNKVDRVEKLPSGLRTWIELLDEASKVLSERGAYGDMMARLVEIVASYSKAMHVPAVSARTGVGMEDLHRIVHEVTCSCGDLT